MERQKCEMVASVILIGCNKIIGNVCLAQWITVNSSTAKKFQKEI